MLVGMHHTGDGDHSRSGIRFYGIGCALAHSDFVIYSAMLAELILDCAPRQTFLQVTEVTSRVDVIP